VELRALIALVLAMVAQQPRVRVEVMNTTKVHGLAHRATRYLRDQGFDVVGEGTASAPGDTTLVLDRTNHPEWATRIAHVLGAVSGVPVRVESRPDSSRYVDVTVLLGALWRPPAQTFNP
jgi:LytR cell envelope-related transcriptional attenuator